MARSVAVGALVLLITAALAGCTGAPPDSAPQPTPPTQPPPPPQPPPPAPAMTHAAVPAGARGPAIDQAKGYTVQELGSGLYYLTDGTYQIMFLTTGQGVIVVDAPPNLGNKTLAAIASVTTEPITHVIYSHSHADHIGSAAQYPANATYIAHQEVADALRRVKESPREVPFGVLSGGGPVPMPTVTFTDNHTLTVGTQTLQLRYQGPAHEPGNIFIYAPKQKVLMFIDVIFPGWIPFMELALAEDIRAFVKAHDQVLAYDFDHLIAGHVTRLGTRADVVTQKEYVLEVQANALKSLQSVDFFAVANKVGFDNPWLLFDTYFNAVADECNRLTVQGWTARLGGADVWTRSHCFVMIESLRID